MHAYQWKYGGNCRRESPDVCDLTPIKNTASGESAVKCSKNDNRVEYL